MSLATALSKWVFFFYLWRGWNLFLRAAKSGHVLRSDLLATCVHFTETGRGPWHHQATWAAKSQALSFEQIASHMLPSRKWKHSQWHSVQLLSVAFGNNFVTREGQETKVFLSDLFTKPALDRGRPLSLVPCGSLSSHLSPVWVDKAGRQAGRQRDLFQLPLTLFIITNMKGRERDGVYRTGSLCNLIYLSPAAVRWAVSSFVSDAGNWNMNLCWWENKGTERGINLIFLQPSKISFLWRRGLYFCN